MATITPETALVKHLDARGFAKRLNPMPKEIVAIGHPDGLAELLLAAYQQSPSTDTEWFHRAREVCASWTRNIDGYRSSDLIQSILSYDLTKQADLKPNQHIRPMKDWDKVRILHKLFSHADLTQALNQYGSFLANHHQQSASPTIRGIELIAAALSMKEQYELEAISRTMITSSAIEEILTNKQVYLGAKLQLASILERSWQSPESPPILSWYALGLHHVDDDIARSRFIEADKSGKNFLLYIKTTPMDEDHARLWRHVPSLVSEHEKIFRKMDRRRQFYLTLLKRLTGTKDRVHPMVASYATDALVRISRRAIYENTWLSSGDRITLVQNALRWSALLNPETTLGNVQERWYCQRQLLQLSVVFLQQPSSKFSKMERVIVRDALERFQRDLAFNRAYDQSVREAAKPLINLL